MRKEVIVGAFVLLAAIMFVVGMNYMKGSKLLGNSLTLYTTYSNVQGIVRGNPVIINGYRAGRVMDMQLSPTEVKVTLELDDNIGIPNDSEARIVSMDALGSKAIQIVFGKSGTMLADESTIRGTTEAGMMDKISALAQDEKLLSRIDSITLNLANVLAGANAAVMSVNEKNRIQAILGSLQAVSGEIAVVTGDLKKVSGSTAAITGNIAAKNAEIAAIVSNAKRTTDSVAVATAQLGPVLTDAKASVASLQQTLSVLQTDQSSVGKILYRPDLYTRIDSIATSVDQLLDDMKLHPKRYFDVDVYLIERKKKAE